MAVIVFYTQRFPFLFKIPKGLSLVDSTKKHLFPMRLKQVDMEWANIKYTRNISMYTMFLSPSPWVMPFSFLHLDITRFLFYWLIITFDLIVSIPYDLRHSRLSVKENRDIEGHADPPTLYLKKLASQLPYLGFVILPQRYCKTA